MLSRREYEKRLREDQEAAAHVFQDFISTFQGTTEPQQKTFVRSGLLYPDSKAEDVQSNELYTPKSIIKPNNELNIKNAIECARILKIDKIDKSKKQSKPLSNLEQLKEELKTRHAERDVKCKYKEELQNLDNFTSTGDPNSTNLFVANLNQNVTEADLLKLFGTYGPLASVKIMWPRGEDRSTRNTNCGFVAFMSRRDAERALNGLKDRTDMRVGWGKCIEIPPNPIYIPQSLLKTLLPPPCTGLPFNAQPSGLNYKKPQTSEEMDMLLEKSIVKVTIPLDKKILMLIHRMIEFTIREGPIFEAFMMNEEVDNPDYKFLFDYKSPLHVYYRWKLYSIRNGESQKQWSLKPFRMYKGGSIWFPPATTDYSAGMPDELFTTEKPPLKTRLSNTQVNRLIGLIRDLTPSKISIAEAMIFCLQHKTAIGDCLSIIIDSLMSDTAKPLKIISRLYLLSDLLYNFNATTNKIKISDNITPADIIKVFKHFKTIDSNLKCWYDKDSFRTRCLKVLHTWDIWKLLETNVLQQLESIIETKSGCDETDDDSHTSSDEPLDGATLIKRSIKSNPVGVVTAFEVKDNPQTADFNMPSGFIVSKWDEIDPEEVEAQAMSSIKLYQLEQQRKERSPHTKREVKSRSNSRNRTSGNSKKCFDYHKIASKWDSDEEEMNPKGRTTAKEKLSDKKVSERKMKRITYLTRKYREDLEDGYLPTKRGLSISKQVERYRKRLIKEVQENIRE